MATYRVPPPGGFTDTHATAAPSVTRGPDPLNSRRPSVSNDPMQPTTNGTAKPGDVAMVPMGASTAKQTQLAGRPTYVERHPEEVKPGWSRGRKICCGLLLFFIAALITIGVLIAFMVRMPSVDYKDYRFICPNNNWSQCATREFQVLVFLEVDNPNILGATINADLALYWEGEYVGPGTIDDTSVGKRGQTELQALFTINSAKGLELARALVLPPQRSVVLDVEGTVYVHVGLLRPSGQFDDKFTIDPPNLSDLINGAVGETPPVSDIVDGIIDNLPFSNTANDQQANAPNAPTPTQLSVIRMPGLRGSGAANPTPSSSPASAAPYLMTPRQFVREMQKIGALPMEGRQSKPRFQHAATALTRRVHRQLRNTQRLGQ